MASDGEYEYDYSEDDEDYVLEDDEDTMDWKPMSTSSDNPNAAPTLAGTYGP